MILIFIILRRQSDNRLQIKRNITNFNKKEDAILESSNKDDIKSKKENAKK